MEDDPFHEGDPARTRSEAAQVADGHADDLAALHRVSTLPPADPEERLGQWLDAGRAALDARQGVVLLGLDSELLVRATTGGPEAGVLVGDEIVDDRIEEALNRRATVAVLGGTSSRDEAELGAGSLVASPLWVSGEIAGAVAFLAEPDHPPFETWALALIDVVADGVARVLEHQEDVRARIRVESRAEAMIDLIPDPIVRLGRDGREIGSPSAELFDPCRDVREPGSRPGPATHERLVNTIAQALDAGSLRTAVFASDRGALARRVEARFVPAAPHEVLCIVRDITDRHRAEQALAEQVAFEALVTAISTRLISCTPANLDDAIVIGLGEIARFFGADRAFIDELSADGATLHLSHLWTRPGHDGGRRRGQRVDLAGFAWLTARFERAGHVFAKGPRHMPPEASRGSLMDPEDLGVLWVRLGTGGDLSGVVGLAWTTRQPQASDEVLGLVRFAADAFHGAIRRRSVALLADGQAEVFEAIARSEPVATALLGAGRLLARHTLGATVRIVTVGEGRLHLVNDDPADPWVEWFAERAIDLGNPYGQAVVTGETVAVADARSDPRFGADAVPDLEFRSVAVVPVRSPRDGRTLALIILLGAEPAATTPRVAVRDSAISLVTVALEREQDERRLAHQATHDPLTGVGNRAALLDRLNLVLARARRTNRPVAVLFCDLDGFKAVNDQFGHDRGDRLLVEVATRIRGAVRPSDTVSRTGGDEFVVVCEDLSSTEQAHLIAGRVLDAVQAAPIDLGEAQIDMRMSIGVALADPVLEDPDRLLRNADLAMYEMKERSRAAGDGAGGEGGPQAASRQPLDSFGRDLAQAIAQGELELHQQPLVGRDGSLAGVEALLRWHNPRHGALGPERIVAAAADLDLSTLLGRWVRREALSLREQWDIEPGDRRPPVHVNVAGGELTAPGFVEDLLDDLRSAAVGPDDLVLEVRESDLLTSAARPVLADLDRLAVPVIVDGVAQGGLPLDILASLPVRGIKLSPDLVRRIEDEPSGVEVVRSVVLLAHGLGWRSMAVGVETERQRAVLFGFGVDAVQGRAVAMPVPADAFSRWLGDRPERH
ncbi:MAG: domain S-box/diguanylate cyclase protein [Acidimicrobiales bacterium]|nr:domain S-box/diguanylate cyclase protein [Acidimicrobiales bacterium]